MSIEAVEHDAVVVVVQHDAAAAAAESSAGDAETVHGGLGVAEDVGEEVGQGFGDGSGGRDLGSRRRSALGR